MAIGRFTLCIVPLLLMTVAAMDVPLTVRKCCPVNDALNPSPMYCNTAPNLRDAYFHFNAAITGFGKPHCRGGEVIVEYSSATTSMTLNGDGYLSLPVFNNLKASVHIPAESFCVDNALLDYAMNASNVWAAWVCQPGSACDQMPCVLKCCGPSEYMKVVDEIPQCVAHENKKPFVPLFHTMDNSSAFEEYVEVYGVKHHAECLANMDDLTVGDHFLLGSKSLRIINNHSRNVYENFNYCVENVDDDSHTLKIYFCAEKSVFWWLLLTLWTPTLLVSITLVVHLIVTSTSTVMDRSHFRFLICMVLSHSGLCVSSLLTDTHWLICWALSHFVFYISLSYYTWLSVVIYEIYRFYRLKCSGSSMKNQFCYYSIYAWGTPLVVMMISRALQYDHIFLYITNPSNTSCWYQIMSYEHYQMVVAIILLWTLVMCGLIKWNMRKLTREANQQISDVTFQAKSSKHIRLVIVIVLAAFVVMGLKIVIQSHYIEEIFEVGPGIFVFIIFGLNRSTIATIKQKWSKENDEAPNSDIGLKMTVD